MQFEVRIMSIVPGLEGTGVHVLVHVDLYGPPDAEPD